jgi:hypothetical protein
MAVDMPIFYDLWQWICRSFMAYGSGYADLLWPMGDGLPPKGPWTTAEHRPRRQAASATTASRTTRKTALLAAWQFFCAFCHFFVERAHTRKEYSVNQKSEKNTKKRIFPRFSKDKAAFVVENIIFS